jgi:hypothetical protein
VRAKALQEGPYTASKALDGHNIDHPLPAAQGDRQATLSEHGDSTYYPIVEHDPRVAWRLYGTRQLRKVDLEGVFEDGHLGGFRCFIRAT